MLTTLLTVAAVTFLAFALAMLLMATGVLAKRPCLKGSCGGIACADCPNRTREEAE